MTETVPTGSRVTAANRNRKKIVMGMRKHLRNMSSEVMETTMTKRRDCIKKAQEIVTHLIEPEVDRSWILENLKHINQSHFDDVIEERFVSLLCGYPLCGNSLNDIPKQHYVISTKTNRVYDITDRKKYCSSFCYKASKYIRDQMHTSPLWLREFEENIKFELYEDNSSSETAGVEMNSRSTEQINFEDTIITHISEEKEIKVMEQSRNPQVEIKVKKGHPKEDFWRNKREVGFRKESTFHSWRVEEENGENEGQSDKVEQVFEIRERSEKNEEATIEGKVINEESNINELRIENKQENREKDEKTRIISTIRARNKVKISLLDVVINIEKKMREWFTVDSLCFLLGENMVERMFEEVGVNYHDLDRIGSHNIHHNEKCMELCNRLSVAELEENSRKREVVIRNPIPDFEKLKEDSKELQIKVRAFYSGDKKVTFSEESKEKEEDGMEPVVPLIHRHAVRNTRARILLNKLCKEMMDIQSVIGISPDVNITHDVKALVATFNLGPNNILFRPSEYGLISIMMFKLLSIRDKQLNEIFNSKIVSGSVEQILTAFERDTGYLDRLVSYLTDIGPLLQNENIGEE